MNKPDAHVLGNLPHPPLYSRALDFERLYQEFPPAPEYFRPDVEDQAAGGPPQTRETVN